MKYFITIFLLSFALSGFTQSFKIRQDTIFNYETPVGLILKLGKKKVAYFESSSSMDLSRDWIKSVRSVSKSEVHSFLFRELLVFDGLTNKVLKDGLSVGDFEKKERDYIGDNNLLVTIYNSEISREFVIYSWRAINPKTRVPKIEYDFDEEQKRRKQKLRIERFFAEILLILDGELDPIEGVYKSIDQGEGTEYDIVIRKDVSNNRDYIAQIIASTNPNYYQIGNSLFSLKKTAQDKLYFVKYSLRNGETFENKTANLNGALLTMGIKSFIKMYPAEGEKRRYREINPMVDWETSGSGVLMNSSGYIATNNHVIKGAKSIRVAFQNDSIDYNASIISQNEINDIAIIKIVDQRFEKRLDPVNWSTKFKLGQKVFTLGYPISYKMSDNVKVVDGIVSGMNGRDGIETFFQTTLPVWYGNSGGPCFNDKGEILGLATQILFDREAKVDNVAYITKSQNVLSLSGDLIDQENIVKNDGIKEDAKSYGLEELIEKLVPYSAFIKVNY
ncbi:S1C family serine protease [Cyclobacteriaceae bacterium]|nr:S1C family serine protease [Cyclobacteriaceae bacterium]